MKKYFILLATAISTFIGSDSHAQCYLPQTLCEDVSIYVSAFGGANFLSSHTSNCVKYEFNPGYLGGLAVGCEFDIFRAELEVAYRYNNLHKATIHGQKLNVSLHASSWSYMANAYYDFDVKMCFNPYVGFGIGYVNSSAHGKLRSYNSQYSVKGHADSDGFAAQGIVGVSTEICNSTIVALEYRYFSAKKNLTEQNAVISARYTF